MIRRRWKDLGKYLKNKQPIVADFGSIGAELIVINAGRKIEIPRSIAQIGS
jgi:hypothetical protein